MSIFQLNYLRRAKTLMTSSKYQIWLEAGKRNWEKEGFNSQNDESTADGHPIFWNSGKFSV